MTIGQSLKKGFEVASKSKAFAFFFLGVIAIQFGISFLFNKLSGLADAPPDLSKAAPEVIGKVIVLGVLGAILNLVVSSFVQAGLLGVVRDKIKAGQAVTTKFFAEALRYFGKLFTAQLLLLLFFLGLTIVAVIAGAALSQVQRTAGLIAALAIFGVALYFLILWSFGPMIIVLQEEGVIASLKKSYGFVRKNFLSIIGLFLLIGLLMLAGIVGFLLIGGAFSLLGTNPIAAIFSIVFLALLMYFISWFGIFSTASVMSYYLGRSTQV